jgi:metal-responsive CopG/Arc/MetJ family transcriptional regulator
MLQNMRKILGFSVPPKLAEEFEALCTEEHRTKSEMFREMFRSYMYLRSQAGSHLLTFLERHGKQQDKT